MNPRLQDLDSHLAQDFGCCDLRHQGFGTRLRLEATYQWSWVEAFGRRP